MANSVENEFYCLRLFSASACWSPRPTCACSGAAEALVVVMALRSPVDEGRSMLRLPQEEDCCQSLSVPPSHKHESDGGPGIADIIRLSWAAQTTRRTTAASSSKAQILFG